MTRPLSGGTISGMDEPPELHSNAHWRMAVWALRVGYGGLGVAIAGVIVMATGSTPWVRSRWGDHLARRRRPDLGRCLLVPARTARAPTRVLVNAIHAHPRHGSRPVVGPAVLSALDAVDCHPPQRNHHWRLLTVGACPYPFA